MIMNNPKIQPRIDLSRCKTGKVNYLLVKIDYC
ncbi:hypothetical protein K737_300573 [Holospora undulata HU1]|uniref:Uncharacterized protein n=1 Tax=Holospora undulata HU1 TaxID=1321371 RepID=A0A061JIQ4_9PROT|nr:hypothetical protein K737_300573 [Holospora undulata HU1]